ncbi:sarcosine oxidase subunit delta, partial [Bradyrhizobium sp. Lot11]
MASLISCPHCGARPKEEFSIRGDAGLVRPAPDAGQDAWYGYV